MNYIVSFIPSFGFGDKPERHLQSPVKWEDFSAFLSTAEPNEYGAVDLQVGGRTYCLWTKDKGGKEHVYIQEKEKYKDVDKTDRLDGTLTESGGIDFDRQKFSEDLDTTQKIIAAFNSRIKAKIAKEEKAKDSKEIGESLKSLETSDEVEVDLLLKRFREGTTSVKTIVRLLKTAEQADYFLSRLSKEETTSLLTGAGVFQIFLKLRPKSLHSVYTAAMQ